MILKAFCLCYDPGGILIGRPLTALWVYSRSIWAVPPDPSATTHPRVAESGGPFREFNLGEVKMLWKTCKFNILGKVNKSAQNVIFVSVYSTQKLKVKTVFNFNCLSVWFATNWKISKCSVNCVHILLRLCLTPAAVLHQKLGNPAATGRQALFSCL